MPDSVPWAGLVATAKVSGFDSGSVPVSVIAFAVWYAVDTDCGVAVGAVFGGACTTVEMRTWFRLVGTQLAVKLPRK